MHARASYGNREISGSAAFSGPHREGNKPEPMMHDQTCHSSGETGERSRSGGCGVGGAKGQGQGERERARHMPETKPGRHVFRSGARMDNGQAEEERAAHGATKSCDDRAAAGCLFLAETGCGNRSVRGNMG